MTQTLLDHLATYPGGTTKLIKDSGVTSSVFYSFVRADTLRPSITTIAKLAKTLGSIGHRSPFDDCPMNASWLIDAWHATKEEQTI